MQTYPKVILKPGKEQPLRRFHPWVFSGAIAKILGKPKDGDTVDVQDAAGQHLATGHYHAGSIAVKVFAFGEKTDIHTDFWLKKLQAANALRNSLFLPETNAYRLVHGEGDGLPGLIVDMYNGVAVLQAHSVGMHRERGIITEALQLLFGEKLLAVYDKSHESLPEQYANQQTNGYLFLAGEAPVLPHPIQEHGHTFLINWETGQKTGFFLDQRENRALVARYAAGRKVLNAFCYSGGFSVYALAAGAAEVHSVDASAKAIALTHGNITANGFEERHAAYEDDVLKYLKNSSDTYDLIVLDPPAYAKSVEARHRAVQGYKRLNAEGLKHIRPGGILMTFSCSQVVDTALFYHTIVAAALEARREVRVLHHLSQGPDHPVNFFHPEGHYLKGLALFVQ